jgi:DNA invertase Pin-like site-specific DNA recombinase
VGRTIAYCRVSSRDQNPELQLDALHTHGYDRLFAEKESGKRGVERPEFTTALSVLEAGDTLVFWKSDRWDRSAAHVLTTINELRDRGVTVKSLTENFDLDTKEGRFMFAVLAAAEYELELRAERQAEGIATARRRQAEGRMLPGKKHIGRPRVTGPAEITTLRRLVADGTSVTQAARTLKISAPPLTPRSAAHADPLNSRRPASPRPCYRSSGISDQISPGLPGPLRGPGSKL